MGGTAARAELTASEAGRCCDEQAFRALGCLRVYKGAIWGRQIGNLGLKGAAPETLTLYVEGGTLGDITLHVSDMPLILPGDRGVFFIGRTSSGLDVPHKRGHGILILDADDLVTGTGLSLNDIRSQIVQP